MTPVSWQRIEGAVIGVAGLTGARWLEPGWPIWAWVLLALAPDLSFAAYKIGPRFGAWIYNFVHLYALGAALLAMGAFVGLPQLSALGALWMAHCGVDRAFGYGLKEQSGFHDTHLGRIGPR